MHHQVYLAERLALGAGPGRRQGYRDAVGRIEQVAARAGGQQLVQVEGESGVAFDQLALVGWRRARIGDAVLVGNVEGDRLDLASTGCVGRIKRPGSGRQHGQDQDGK